MIPITPTCLLLAAADLNPWTFVWAGLMVVRGAGGSDRDRPDQPLARSDPRPTTCPPATSSPTIGHCMEAGTLSKEEYDRVRTLLASRIAQSTADASDRARKPRRLPSGPSTRPEETPPPSSEGSPPT